MVHSRQAGCSTWQASSSHAPLDFALFGVGEVGGIGVAAVAQRAANALAPGCLAAAACSILLLFYKLQTQAARQEKGRGGAGR